METRLYEIQGSEFYMSVSYHIPQLVPCGIAVFLLKHFIFLENGKNCHSIVFTVLRIHIKIESLKADSLVSGNQIRPKRKWTICYWRLFFMTVSIRGAPVEDNTASECVRTVAATYGCKYEYTANVYGYDANCEWHPKDTSSCSIKDSWLPRWGISASVWPVML